MAGAQDVGTDAGTDATTAELPARCTAAVDPGVIAREREDLTALSSDAMDGRAPGTPGGVAAADYIIRALRAMGVSPAGTKDYRQAFPLAYGRDVTGGTTVLLRRGGEALLLDRGVDYHVVAGSDGRGTLPVTFVGHGISAPAAGWEEYPAGSLHGHVAVILAEDPVHPGDSGPVPPVLPVSERVRAARAHGAEGVVVVDPGPTLSPATDVLPAVDGAWVLRLTRARAAWLLGVTESALAPRTIPAPARSVSGATVSLVIETRARTVTTANVLGVVHGITPLPGGAPHGVLLVGAHYDHLGHGGPTSRAPGSTEIHHGADDNASGSTVLLELARRVVRHPVGRDVVFAWFGGEEEGLVGSRYWVAHRPPGLQDVTAMLNFDMVGRLRHCRLYVEGVDTARGLAERVNQANAPYGFDTHPWDQHDPWGASDHFSFHDAHIPVVFFFTGLHPDYHTPVDQADRVAYPGLAAVTDYGEAVLRALDAAPAGAFAPR